MNPQTSGEPSMGRNNSASFHTILRVMIAVAIFGATFLAITGVAGLYCFFAPRVYLSKVTVEAKQDHYNMLMFEGDSYPKERDPWLQFQVIQSNLPIGNASVLGNSVSQTLRWEMVFQIPDANSLPRVAKRSFGDKRVPNREIGNEGKGRSLGTRSIGRLEKGGRNA